MFNQDNSENLISSYNTVCSAKVREVANNSGITPFETELKFLRNGVVPLKYLKTVQAIGLEKMIQLRLSKVAVLGCGGVGGFLCETLTRMGIGSILAIDGDIYDETNLNRQLYSYEDNIGKPKSKVTWEMLCRINSISKISYFDQKLSVDNFLECIGDSSVVVDAIDRLDDRLSFSHICGNHGIPYFFGNIGSSDFRVGIQSQQSNLVERIFKNTNITDPAEGCPVITAGLCGIALAGEVIKYLLGIEGVLLDKIMQVNWHQNECVIIDLALT